METISGTFTARRYPDGRVELFLSTAEGSITVNLSADENALAQAMLGDRVTIEDA
jgi:hypothetical protein